MKSILYRALLVLAGVLNLIPLVISLIGLLKVHEHALLGLVVFIPTSLNILLLSKKFRRKIKKSLKGILSFSMLGNLLLAFGGAMLIHAKGFEDARAAGWLFLTALIGIGLAQKYWVESLREVDDQPIRNESYKTSEQPGRVVVQELKQVQKPVSIEEPSRPSRKQLFQRPKDSGFIAPIGMSMAVVALMMTFSDQEADRGWGVLEANAAFFFAILYLWLEIKRRYPSELVTKMRIWAILSAVCGVLIAPLMPIMVGYQYYRLYQALVASRETAQVDYIKAMYILACLLTLISAGIILYGNYNLFSRGHL